MKSKMYFKLAGNCREGCLGAQVYIYLYNNFFEQKLYINIYYRQYIYPGQIAMKSKMLFRKLGHAAIGSYSNEAIKQNTNAANGSYNINQSVSHQAVGL